MLGFLGSSFIGERMFDAIKKPIEQSFDFKEYLIYQDTVYHGNEDEKNLLSFRILDLSGTGRVEY
jgi:Ca2+-binding EF-hand superfamily protein